MPNRVSLAELAASDIRLRPAEAVAIVSAICAQHSAGTLRGIPSPGVIRLTRDGDVVAEGPMTTAQDDVARAGLLLTDLLSGFDALPEYRASGALRLVIARAIGTVDLPPYASLDDFCTALARFASEDVRDVAQGLFSAWERSRASRAFRATHGTDLTISDVRRARRATGLSLGYLSTVAEVPSRRLRDLEWGYMRDWPATAEGRTQVIRYARAAGLDESIVLSIAWPMILEGSSIAAAPAAPSVALVRSGPQALTAVQPAPLAVRPPRRWRGAVVAAAATAALIAAFVFGARSSPPDSRDGMRADLPVPAAPGVVASRGAASETNTAIAGPSADAPRTVRQTVPPGRAARAALVPVVHSRDISGTAGAAGVKPAPVAALGPRPARRRAPADREPPRKPSVFERELFRIVIR